MISQRNERAVILGLTIGVIAGLVMGSLISASLSTSDDALDRVCYQELGPEWSYDIRSAQYWGETLKAECIKNPAQDNEKIQHVYLGVKQ